MTVGATIRSTARALDGVASDPGLDARLLVAHVLERDAAWLVAHGDATIDEEAARRLQGAVARRASGEPLAYVTGAAWFYGRAFAVGPDVLVPRPETELVVEAALDELRANASRCARPMRACDVGTGSGAIAVTLAAEHAGLRVVASDCSASALRVARANARRLGVGARVRFVAGDLAAPLLPLGPFDCVVANLPYVPTADVPARPDPVAFEPRLAVDGGRDGLGLYRRLVADLPALLAPAGCAFLEAAPGTVGPLSDIAAAALPRAQVEIGEDLAGLERWVAVTMP